MDGWMDGCKGKVRRKRKDDGCDSQRQTGRKEEGV